MEPYFLLPLGPFTSQSLGIHVCLPSESIAPGLSNALLEWGGMKDGTGITDEMR